MGEVRVKTLPSSLAFVTKFVFQGIDSNALSMHRNAITKTFIEGPNIGSHTK